MMKRTQFGQAVITALAAGLVAMPAWAGQINLVSRSTSISETASVTESSTESIGMSTINRDSTVVSTTTSSITISETFSATAAAVSVEVSQDGVDYTSPHDNTLVTGSVTQSVNVVGTAGVTNVGVSAGAANVSVASTAIIDGGVIGSITPSTSSGHAAALALTPGFALQNSNANAIALIANDAFVSASLTSKAFAIDIQQADLNEYSPHDNTMAAALLDQGVTVDSTVGVTNVQVQAGVANVSASHTSVVYLGGDTAGSVFAP